MDSSEALRGWAYPAICVLLFALLLAVSDWRARCRRHGCLGGSCCGATTRGAHAGSGQSSSLGVSLLQHSYAPVAQVVVAAAISAAAPDDGGGEHAEQGDGSLLPPAGVRPACARHWFLLAFGLLDALAHAIAASFGAAGGDGANAAAWGFKEGSSSVTLVAPDWAARDACGALAWLLALLVAQAIHACCFYMPAQWEMAYLQWAAGETMCHLPRRPALRRARRHRRVARPRVSESSVGRSSSLLRSPNARRDATRAVLFGLVPRHRDARVIGPAPRLGSASCLSPPRAPRSWPAVASTSLRSTPAPLARARLFLPRRARPTDRGTTGRDPGGWAAC